MSRSHIYHTHTAWTGNRGSGTLDYRAYARDHEIRGENKATHIEGSSDPLFRGDAERYNPEELFLASLSSCHMLWYLHLAAVNGVVVLAYEDHAEGEMEEAEDGAGRFTRVTLRPRVRISRAGQIELADALHAEAGKKCFIANSVRVELQYAPQTTAG
ncbi:OsmC family protein [Lewinella sp. IMCC34183]|uniref:OsmC family protein n=1 Tax=Lewinella sp. IMCC34183 TaxID=2248762 RepID=UPI000E2524BB|nr:OsmC family protein [Lewinella sp. IMCC34183]